MNTSELHDAALNQSPTGHYLLTPSVDPTFISVNDTFLKLSSRSREELIGKKLFEVFGANPVDGEDSGLDALKASLQRVIETHQVDVLYAQRYPIKMVDGRGNTYYEERFWTASSVPIIGHDGQLECISHHTSDVTERVHAEAKLRKSEARYKTLTDSIDEGFCVVHLMFDDFRKSLDYRFLEVNSAFEKWTGLSDVIGKTMKELVPGHEEVWFEIYGQVAMSGESVRFIQLASQLGRWYDVYAYRIGEPQERVVGILFKDITHQREKDEAIRISELRLRSLTEATSDVIYRMSADWTHLHQLEGRGYLKDVTETSADWLDAYIPIEDQEPVRQAILMAIHSKSYYELEHRVLRIDGSYGWTYSRAVPMLDAKGEVYEWIGTASDITARKDYEEKLKANDRLKDEFLAMLAHELRNPLAPIAAAAKILTLPEVDEHQIRSTSNIIARQVKHMTGLVDDLLDVSRVTFGQIEIQKSNVDMKKVVSESVEQVRPLIELRGHQLTVHTQPQSAFVYGDHERLVQVVTNILSNSAKYTPEGGLITLTMEVDGHVDLSITDNGIGMAEDILNRVFELFAQATRSSDRSQGGLGLGLALAKRLVELHEGVITAHSKGLGKGSTLRVKLPRVDSISHQDSIDGAINRKIGHSEEFNIIVVDDNVDAADMLSMMLGLIGYQVSTESSSIKTLDNHRPEQDTVYILDIGLPDMDGRELAKRLRGISTDAFIIALTGYGHKENDDLLPDGPFNHYLVKPVDVKQLEEILLNVSFNR